MGKNDIKQETMLNVSSVETNFEDYTQSANTLFHFMGKMDFLKIALKNKMKILIGTMISTTISNVGPIYSLLLRKKEKYKTVR